MSTTDLAVDPDTLTRLRRQLLREELDLGPLLGRRVSPPDTGETTALTAAVLARVGDEITEVAHDLHGVADALGRLLDDVLEQDRRVTSLLDLLRSRGSA